jgi:4-hydroxy-tetrahydrodipicolinate synthase
MRALAHNVMNLGAAGVMIAPSAAAKTDDSIATYFLSAVEAIGKDIPWVLQDYPLSTGVTMAPSLIKRVVAENPSLSIIKHEDWPGLDKITTLRGYEKEGSMRPISILVGNNGLFLDFELDRGVDGANTGYPFPDMLVEMAKLANSGSRDKAHDLFDAHLPLLRYEQQPSVGLSVRKYVLKRRGVISSESQRKPAASMSAVTRGEVDYLLARLAKTDQARRLVWR